MTDRDETNGTDGQRRFWVDGIEMVDNGPPHKGLLCLGPTGDWLCRQRADNGHTDHAPYVEGEYLRPAHNDGPSVAEAAADDRRWWDGEKAGETNA